MHLLHRWSCPWDSDNLPSRRYIGDYGELVASSWLRSQGLKVLRRNFRWGDSGEIDIVCREQDQLIFCDPTAAVPAVTALQWRLVEGRGEHNVNFCDSPEVAILLSSAGFGVSVMPEILVPSPQVGQVTPAVIADAPEISFGLYYAPGEQSPQLAGLIRLLKEDFIK